MESFREGKKVEARKKNVFKEKKKKWQRRGIKLAILREQAVEIPRGNGSSGMGLVPGGLIHGGWWIIKADLSRSSPLTHELHREK